MDIFKLYNILTEGSTQIFATEDLNFGDIPEEVTKEIDAALKAHDNFKDAYRAAAAVIAQAKKDGKVAPEETLYRPQTEHRWKKIQAGQTPTSKPSAPVTVSKPVAAEEPAGETENEFEAEPERKTGLNRAQEVAILGKLQAGATPEELAAEYEVSADTIRALNSSEEGDLEDFEIAPEEDEKEVGEPKIIEVPGKEMSLKSVEKEISDKIERAFYLNPKADKQEVINNIKKWADKRDEKVDFTKPQHPLKGVPQDEIDRAINVAAGKIGKQKVSASKRRENIFLKGVEGDDSGRIDNPEDVKKSMGLEFDSFQNFSETLSEHMKTLKSTSVMRYPHQITFSEDFVNKLAEEYASHMTLTEDRGVIRNLEEKMVKALRMHIHEIAKRSKESMMKEVKEEPDNIEILNHCADKHKLNDQERRKLIGIMRRDAHLAKKPQAEAIKIIDKWIEDHKTPSQGK